MLAYFDKPVAKCPEEFLTVTQPEGVCAKTGALMIQHFASTVTGSVTINLGSSGALAYTTEKQNPLLPRLFAVVDDVFCLFEGHIENIGQLKQLYGLSKTANEVTIIIEAYKTLRDRGPYPADHVVRSFDGKYAFVLFDATIKSTFIAVDADAGVKFFWGADSEGHLLVSDDVEIMKAGCGKSYAPFPKGCFFTTSKGLQSYEHPMNQLKAMPRVDSEGDVCGPTFSVDKSAKKDSNMPRVGSAANWSSHF